MTKIIIVNETPQWSILSDTFTYGGMVLLLWFNHKYLSGSAWLDIFLLLIFFVAVLGRNSKHRETFDNYADAKKYLDKLSKDKDEHEKS